MAKQTFTTGQVLTAAQMTSLQQTAMGGGSTTAKTASYVLVAADAGTVVQMNSASATTITVNTALFAAGDSVQIQNIGAGVCTVTAGTATVNTAGSLALSQYEGGQLYFNSASAAIFFDIVQSSSAPAFNGALARNTSSQSIPNATWTAVVMNSEIFDSSTYWDTGANTRFTIPTTGKYSISAQALSTSTGSSCYVAVYKNGSAFFQLNTTNNPNGQTVGGTTITNLTAADYIQLYVFQNQGSAATYYGDTGDTGAMQWSITFLGA